jgi:hypothetical protein
VSVGIVRVAFRRRPIDELVKERGYFLIHCRPPTRRRTHIVGRAEPRDTTRRAVGALSAWRG